MARETIHIPRALYGIRQRLDREFAELLQRLGPLIVAKWEDKILEVKAIDRGWYYGSVGIGEITGGELIVDTSSNPDVTYSDIVERGRRDTANYKGRFPAKLAVESLENDIRGGIDLVMDRTFS